MGAMGTLACCAPQHAGFQSALLGDLFEGLGVQDSVGPALQRATVCLGEFVLT
jgi:hypothetical protein